jgi:hypothetical protein
MVVINVACPYCGEETYATIPKDSNLKQIKKRRK